MLLVESSSSSRAPPLLTGPVQINSFIGPCFQKVTDIYEKIICDLYEQIQITTLSPDERKVCYKKIEEHNRTIIEHLKLCQNLYKQRESTVQRSPEEWLKTPIRHPNFSFSFVCLEKISHIFFEVIYPLQSSVQKEEVPMELRDSYAARIKEKNQEIRNISKLWKYLNRLERSCEPHPIRQDNLKYTCLEEIAAIQHQKILPLKDLFKSGAVNCEFYESEIQHQMSRINLYNQLSAHLHSLESVEPQYRKIGRIVDALKKIRRADEEAERIIQEVQSLVSDAKEKLTDPSFDVDEMEVQREIIEDGMKLIRELRQFLSRGSEDVEMEDPFPLFND